MASAPAEAAAMPSSGRVMPQILTRVRFGWLIELRRLPNQGGRRKLRDAELGRVVDPAQVETVRWGSHTTQCAITRLQHLACPIGVMFTTADGHQYTGDVAHHVVQKTIGLHIDEDEFTL